MQIFNVCMKRFVIRLIAFLFVMLTIDRGFGMVMNYLQENAKGGYIGHHNYILQRANEDILIFGSSRALHHYNPQIVIDSLGMNCYNCGQDGNGIILFYGWWQIIKERHMPKLVIYDVNPDFDLFKGDNYKYLGWLKSEYDNERVKRIFEDIDPTEKFKMQSMMYRYNSKFLQYITDYFHPFYEISSNGYLPLNGKMNKMKIKENSFKDHIDSYDFLKLTYLEDIVKDMNNRGVKIVFVASPIWYGINDAVFGPLQDICNKFKIPFYIFSNDKNFVHNDLMFIDGNHLNAFGADKFTSQMCSIIKETK